jgi:hypothetical protein
MGMIIGRSLTPLNYSRTLRAVRRREMVRRNDDNSRRKMQNVRGGSSDVLARGGLAESELTAVRTDASLATSN